MCGAVPTHTLISIWCLCTGLNPWKFWMRNLFYYSLEFVAYKRIFISRNFNFVLYIIILSLQNWCKNSTGNSNTFEPRVIELTCLVLYFFKDSIYCRVYIRHNKMTCFHLDSYNTISDWWWIVWKSLTHIIRYTKQSAKSNKGQLFFYV